MQDQPYMINKLVDPKTLTIDQVADMVHQNAVEHGFHPTNQTMPDFLNYQLLNLIREVTELHEAWRSGNFDAPCDKAEKMVKQGLEVLTYAEEEYADIIIRALDQCRRLGINISKAIWIKHLYNQTREYKHGNKLS